MQRPRRRRPIQSKPVNCCACWPNFLASLLLSYVANAGSTKTEAPQPIADQFVQDVLRNEVEAQMRDHSLWSYRKLKVEDGKQKLSQVCQTEEGELERLIAINGQPLSPQQAHAEDRRIQKLLTHPDEIRQKQRKEREDGEQARKLLQTFPQAFRFQYDGTEGSLVRAKFTPNPKFHPSGHTEQVFHHMEGELVLDRQAKRLTEISGKLTNEVKFAGGLFGHLDQGGTFVVKQQDVGAHCWEVTKMHVHMSGKALFFKTISVRHDEEHTNFQQVPADTSLQQAAELLRRDAASHAGS
jgi:hypothetical protein